MARVVIPAAGRGVRFGGKAPKQFLTLGGLPMIVQTLIPFQGSPFIEEIICVVPKDEISFVERQVLERSLTKVRRVVPGGERRQDSARAGVSLIEKETGPDEIVLVHDGVRPLVTVSLIDRVAEAAWKFGAAVAALPMTDSLKRVSSEGIIEESVPREEIRAMQTPQGFRLSILSEAFLRAERDGFVGTDEAALVARLGVPVHCVEGDPENIKITIPADLMMAEFFLGERTERGSV